MVCAMNLLFPKFLAITEVLDLGFFNPTNRYNGEKKLVISGSFCNVAGFRGQTITLFPLMPNLDTRHAHVYKSKKGISCMVGYTNRLGGEDLSVELGLSLRS